MVQEKIKPTVWPRRILVTQTKEVLTLYIESIAVVRMERPPNGTLIPCQLRM